MECEYITKDKIEMTNHLSLDENNQFEICGYNKCINFIKLGTNGGASMIPKILKRYYKIGKLNAKYAKKFLQGQTPCKFIFVHTINQSHLFVNTKIVEELSLNVGI